MVFICVRIKSYLLNQGFVHTTGNTENIVFNVILVIQKEILACF